MNISDKIIQLMGAVLLYEIVSWVSIARWCVLGMKKKGE